MYLGLNADLVYLKIYPRPQAPHQGFWSKTGHVLAVAGESKPQTKKLGLYSAPCWSNEVTNMKKKKTLFGRKSLHKKLTHMEGRAALCLGYICFAQT